MSNEELKPCPFCGIEPVTFNQTGLIICAYSMCGVNPESKSKEDWNKRTTDRLEQEVAELREALQSTLNLSDRFVVNALTLAKHDYPLSPSAGIQLKDWKMHEQHIQQLLNK